MSAYKDKTQGTWYVSFRYIDWTGKKTQKLKRGFKTKKEALNYEKEFIRKTAADMKMEMNSFIQVYFEDKKNELKENSIRNKQHMMNKHIVPYFANFIFIFHSTFSGSVKINLFRIIHFCARIEAQILLRRQHYGWQKNPGIPGI